MKIEGVHISDAGIAFDCVDRVDETTWLWFEDAEELKDFIIQLRQILTQDDEKEME